MDSPPRESRKDSAGSSLDHSILHNLYHKILRDFESVYRKDGCSRCRQEGSSSLLRESLSLFYMWAQGLDLHQMERSIDENLEMYNHVSRILRSIQQILHSDAFAIPATRNESMYNTSSEEEDSDSSSSSQNTTDEEKQIHLKHCRYIHRLKQKCTSLMDLLPTIEHCFEIDQIPTHVETAVNFPGNNLILPAEPLVNQIQDKFPQVDPALAKRLGEASWERFHRVRRVLNSRREIESLVTDEAHEGSESEEAEKDEPSTFVPISSFYDSGLGASIPAKSRHASSAASHTSFLSTQSMLDGAFRVPPTPAEVSQGLPFECEYCKKRVENIQTRVQYKIHIFADLQSYICTFGDCKDSRVTFPSRKLWEEHEFRNHRLLKEYQCVICRINFPTTVDFDEHIVNDHQDTDRNSQQWALHKPIVVLIERDIKEESCPLCCHNNFKDRRSFAAHVGRHLEEIALISLPTSNAFGEDTDEEFYNDAADKRTHASFASVDSQMIKEATPTFEGFKQLIQRTYPTLRPFLVERIAHEQLERFKRLQDLESLHTDHIAKQSCVSGRFCPALGGKPHYKSELDQGVKTLDSRSRVLEDQFPQGVPLPPISRWPAEFECTLCFRVINMSNPSAWIKHVHEDLQSFTCTFSMCAEPKSFKRKTDWVRHESERHRRLEWWICDMHDCGHKCYRKDNFVQHLVREHKLTKPPRSKRTSNHSEESDDSTDQLQRLVIQSRRETARLPQDEPCQFCGLACHTWKTLTDHLAKHLEQIALAAIGSLQQIATTTPNKEIRGSIDADEEHETSGHSEERFHGPALGAVSAQSQIERETASWVNAPYWQIENLDRHALQIASAAGDRRATELLLNKNADVNLRGGKYGSPLHAASYHGHQGVVKLLLDAGADVNAQSGLHGTALYAASSQGHQRVVELLLDSGADVNAEGGSYGTALHTASAGGYQGIVDLLLNNGADVNAQSGLHGTALYAASSQGHQRVVELLLDSGANVNAEGGSYGTALNTASAGGYQGTVELLLNNGADVNAQGGIFRNALLAASEKGYRNIVDLLLAHGADVNTEAEPFGNALQAASNGGHPTIVRMLLAHGANANTQGGHYGNALQAASYRGRKEVVQILLANGANVNAQGGQYGNALHAASIGGYKELIQILVDSGATMPGSPQS